MLLITTLSESMAGAGCSPQGVPVPGAAFGIDPGVLAFPAQRKSYLPPGVRWLLLCCCGGGFPCAQKNYPLKKSGKSRFTTPIAKSSLPRCTPEANCGETGRKSNVN